MLQKKLRQKVTKIEMRETGVFEKSVDLDISKDIELVDQ
jgi:hypothetical protein